MGVRINGVWHEELADPGTGGVDNGNGRNFTSAADYSQAASKVTFSPNVNTGGAGRVGAVAPVAATSGGGGGAAGSSLDAQFQKMLAALASGNREAFEFEKEQFNRQFAEQQRQYNQTFGEQQRQFNEQQGINAAALTGQYQGNPTLAAQLQQAQLSGLYNGAPTEAARQFNQSQQQALGTTLLNAATQLRGPRDYLQYQMATRGGQTLMDQLFGQGAIPQTGQATGGPANLQTTLADFRSQGGGGLFGQQLPSQNYALDSGQPNPQAQLLSRFGAVAGQNLNPGQIDPARWDAIGSIGQALTKNLAETVYGYDPEDFERQINSTRPLGTARTAALTFAQPRGIY